MLIQDNIWVTLNYFIDILSPYFHAYRVFLTIQNFNYSMINYLNGNKKLI